jgi:glycosyltransferase involved in cell wall biosynthesis
VSIVIPCFNTGRYVGEAIESALAQTYKPVEVVVVDDGSTDDSAAIARRYSGVRVIRQSNQGVAVARNRGLGECAGEFVVFNDADDRLLPRAVEAGVSVLERQPGAALAYGFHRIIGDGASGISTSRAEITDAGYARFLRGHSFTPPGSAVFRRSAVVTLGGFLQQPFPVEDYEFYLRVARIFPVHCHNETVVEYRLHEENASGRMHRARVLRQIMRVLDEQSPHVKGDGALEDALRSGRRVWKQRLGPRVCAEVGHRLLRGRVISAGAAFATLVVLNPAGLRHFIAEPWRAAGRRLGRSGARHANAEAGAHG